MPVKEDSGDGAVAAAQGEPFGAGNHVQNLGEGVHNSCSQDTGSLEDLAAQQIRHGTNQEMTVASQCCDSSCVHRRLHSLTVLVFLSSAAAVVMVVAYWSRKATTAAADAFRVWLRHSQGKVHDGCPWLVQNNAPATKTALLQKRREFPPWLQCRAVCGKSNKII